MGILSYWIPLGIYISIFIVALLTIFYKKELGLAYVVFFIPLQNVLQKLRLFPLGIHIFDIIILALLIAWLKEAQKGIRDNDGIRGVDLAVFAYIVLTFFSMCWGSLHLGETTFNDEFLDRLANWKNFVIVPFLYIVTVNIVKNEKWIMIVLIVSIMSILLANLFFIREFGWYKQAHYTHSMRVTGPFAYLRPNEIGAFFAQYGILLFGLFLFARQRIIKVLLGLVFILTLYSVLYSFSRAAYMAVPIGLMFVLIFKNRLMLLIFLALLVVSPHLLPDSVIERIEMTTSSEEEWGGTQSDALNELDKSASDRETPKLDSSAQGRFKLWEDAMEMFYSNPIFGAGFQTYKSLHGVDTHGNYYKILAEGGILGFTMYILLYYLAFRSGWKLYREASSEELRGLGIGFCGCVLVNMIVNLTHDNWSYINLMGLYWVFWGLVVKGKLLSNNL